MRNVLQGKYSILEAENKCYYYDNNNLIEEIKNIL